MTTPETYKITMNGQVLSMKPGFIRDSAHAIHVAKQLAMALPDNMVEVVAERCLFNSSVDLWESPLPEGTEPPPPMPWSPPSDLRFNQ